MSFRRQLPPNASSSPALASFADGDGGNYTATLTNPSRQEGGSRIASKNNSTTTTNGGEGDHHESPLVTSPRSYSYGSLSGAAGGGGGPPFSSSSLRSIPSSYVSPVFAPAKDVLSGKASGVGSSSVRPHTHEGRSLGAPRRSFLLGEGDEGLGLVSGGVARSVAGGTMVSRTSAVARHMHAERASPLRQAPPNSKLPASPADERHRQQHREENTVDEPHGIGMRKGRGGVEDTGGILTRYTTAGVGGGGGSSVAVSSLLRPFLEHEEERVLGSSRREHLLMTEPNGAVEEAPPPPPVGSSKASTRRHPLAFLDGAVASDDGRGTTDPLRDAMKSKRKEIFSPSPPSSASNTNNNNNNTAGNTTGKHGLSHYGNVEGNGQSNGNGLRRQYQYGDGLSADKVAGISSAAAQKKADTAPYGRKRMVTDSQESNTPNPNKNTNNSANTYASMTPMGKGGKVISCDPESAHLAEAKQRLRQGVSRLSREEQIRRLQEQFGGPPSPTDIIGGTSRGGGGSGDGNKSSDLRHYLDDDDDDDHDNDEGILHNDKDDSRYERGRRARGRRAARGDTPSKEHFDHHRLPSPIHKMTNSNDATSSDDDNTRTRPLRRSKYDDDNDEFSYEGEQKARRGNGRMTQYNKKGKTSSSRDPSPAKHYPPKATSPEETRRRRRRESTSSDDHNDYNHKDYAERHRVDNEKRQTNSYERGGGADSYDNSDDYYYYGEERRTTTSTNKNSVIWHMQQRDHTKQQNGSSSSKHNSDFILAESAEAFNKSATDRGSSSHPFQHLSSGGSTAKRAKTRALDDNKYINIDEDNESGRDHHDEDEDNAKRGSKLGKRRDRREKASETETVADPIASLLDIPSSSSRGHITGEEGKKGGRITHLLAEREATEDLTKDGRLLIRRRRRRKSSSRRSVSHDRSVCSDADNKYDYHAETNINRHLSHLKKTKNERHEGMPTTLTTIRSGASRTMTAARSIHDALEPDDDKRTTRTITNTEMGQKTMVPPVTTAVPTVPYQRNPTTLASPDGKDWKRAAERGATESPPPFLLPIELQQKEKKEKEKPTIHNPPPRFRTLLSSGSDISKLKRSSSSSSSSSSHLHDVSPSRRSRREASSGQSSFSSTSTRDKNENRSSRGEGRRRRRGKGEERKRRSSSSSSFSHASSSSSRECYSYDDDESGSPNKAHGLHKTVSFKDDNEERGKEALFLERDLGNRVGDQSKGINRKVNDNDTPDISSDKNKLEVSSPRKNVAMSPPSSFASVSGKNNSNNNSGGSGNFAKPTVSAQSRAIVTQKMYNNISGSYIIRTASGASSCSSPPRPPYHKSPPTSFNAAAASASSLGAGVGGSDRMSRSPSASSLFLGQLLLGSAVGVVGRSEKESHKIEGGGNRVGGSPDERDPYSALTALTKLLEAQSRAEAAFLKPTPANSKRYSRQQSREATVREKENEDEGDDDGEDEKEKRSKRVGTHKERQLTTTAISKGDDGSSDSEVFAPWSNTHDRERHPPQRVEDETDDLLAASRGPQPPPHASRVRRLTSTFDESGTDLMSIAPQEQQNRKGGEPTKGKEERERDDHHNHSQPSSTANDDDDDDVRSRQLPLPIQRQRRRHSVNHEGKIVPSLPLMATTEAPSSSSSSRALPSLHHSLSTAGSANHYGNNNNTLDTEDSVLIKHDDGDEHRDVSFKKGLVDESSPEKEEANKSAIAANGMLYVAGHTTTNNEKSLSPTPTTVSAPMPTIMNAQQNNSSNNDLLSEQQPPPPPPHVLCSTGANRRTLSHHGDATRTDAKSNKQKMTEEHNEEKEERREEPHALTTAAIASAPGRNKHSHCYDPTTTNTANGKEEENKDEDEDDEGEEKANVTKIIYPNEHRQKEQNQQPQREKGRAPLADVLDDDNVAAINVNRLLRRSSRADADYTVSKNTSQKKSIDQDTRHNMREANKEKRTAASVAEAIAERLRGGGVIFIADPQPQAPKTNEPAISAGDYLLTATPTPAAASNASSRASSQSISGPPTRQQQQQNEDLPPPIIITRDEERGTTIITAAANHNKKKNDKEENDQKRESREKLPLAHPTASSFTEGRIDLLPASSVSPEPQPYYCSIAQHPQPYYAIEAAKEVNHSISEEKEKIKQEEKGKGSATVVLMVASRTSSLTDNKPTLLTTNTRTARESNNEKQPGVLAVGSKDAASSTTRVPTLTHATVVKEQQQQPSLSLESQQTQQAVVASRRASVASLNYSSSSLHSTVSTLQDGTIPTRTTIVKTTTTNDNTNADDSSKRVVVSLTGVTITRDANDREDTKKEKRMEKEVDSEIATMPTITTMAERRSRRGSTATTSTASRESIVLDGDFDSSKSRQTSADPQVPLPTGSSSFASVPPPTSFSYPQPNTGQPFPHAAASSQQQSTPQQSQSCSDKSMRIFSSQSQGGEEKRPSSDEKVKAVLIAAAGVASGSKNSSSTAVKNAMKVMMVNSVRCHAVDDNNNTVNNNNQNETSDVNYNYSYDHNHSHQGHSKTTVAGPIPSRTIAAPITLSNDATTIDATTVPAEAAHESARRSVSTASSSFLVDVYGRERSVAAGAITIPISSTSLARAGVQEEEDHRDLRRSHREAAGEKQQTGEEEGKHQTGEENAFVEDEIERNTSNNKETAASYSSQPLLLPLYRRRSDATQHPPQPQPQPHQASDDMGSSTCPTQPEGKKSTKESIDAMVAADLFKENNKGKEQEDKRAEEEKGGFCGGGGGGGNGVWSGHTTSSLRDSLADLLLMEADDVVEGNLLNPSNLTSRSTLSTSYEDHQTLTPNNTKKKKTPKRTTKTYVVGGAAAVGPTNSSNGSSRIEEDERERERRVHSRGEDAREHKDEENTKTARIQKVDTHNNYNDGSSHQNDHRGTNAADGDRHTHDRHDDTRYDTLFGELAARRACSASTQEEEKEEAEEHDERERREYKKVDDEDKNNGIEKASVNVHANESHRMMSSSETQRYLTSQHRPNLDQEHHERVLISNGHHEGANDYKNVNNNNAVSESRSASVLSERSVSNAMHRVTDYETILRAALDTKEEGEARRGLGRREVGEGEMGPKRAQAQGRGNDDLIDGSNSNSQQQQGQDRSFHAQNATSSQAGPVTMSKVTSSSVAGLRDQEELKESDKVEDEDDKNRKALEARFASLGMMWNRYNGKPSEQTTHKHQQIDEGMGGGSFRERRVENGHGPYDPSQPFYPNSSNAKQNNNNYRDNGRDTTSHEDYSGGEGGAHFQQQTYRSDNMYIQRPLHLDPHHHHLAPLGAQYSGTGHERMSLNNGENYSNRNSNSGGEEAVAAEHEHGDYDDDDTTISTGAGINSPSYMYDTTSVRVRSSITSAAHSHHQQQQRQGQRRDEREHLKEETLDDDNDDDRQKKEDVGEHVATPHQSSSLSFHSRLNEMEQPAAFAPPRNQKRKDERPPPQFISYFSTKLTDERGGLRIQPERSSGGSVRNHYYDDRESSVVTSGDAVTEADGGEGDRSPTPNSASLSPIRRGGGGWQQTQRPAEGGNETAWLKANATNNRQQHKDDYDHDAYHDHDEDLIEEGNCLDDEEEDESPQQKPKKSSHRNGPPTRPQQQQPPPIFLSPDVIRVAPGEPLTHDPFRPVMRGHKAIMASSPSQPRERRGGGGKEEDEERRALHPRQTTSMRRMDDANYDPLIDNPYLASNPILRVPMTSMREAARLHNPRSRRRNNIDDDDDACDYDYNNDPLNTNDDPSFDETPTFRYGPSTGASFSVVDRIVSKALASDEADRAWMEEQEARGAAILAQVRDNPLKRPSQSPPLHHPERGISTSLSSMNNGAHSDFDDFEDDDEKEEWDDDDDGFTYVYKTQRRGTRHDDNDDEGISQTHYKQGINDSRSGSRAVVGPSGKWNAPRSSTSRVHGNAGVGRESSRPMSVHDPDEEDLSPYAWRYRVDAEEGRPYVVKMRRRTSRGRRSQEGDDVDDGTHDINYIEEQYSPNNKGGMRGGQKQDFVDVFSPSREQRTRQGKIKRVKHSRSRASKEEESPNALEGATRRGTGIRIHQRNVNNTRTSDRVDDGDSDPSRSRGYERPHDDDFFYCPPASSSSAADIDGLNDDSSRHARLHPESPAHQSTEMRRGSTLNTSATPKQTTCTKDGRRIVAPGARPASALAADPRPFVLHVSSTQKEEDHKPADGYVLTSKKGADDDAGKKTAIPTDTNSTVTSAGSAGASLSNTSTRSTVFRYITPSALNNDTKQEKGRAPSPSSAGTGMRTLNEISKALSVPITTIVQYNQKIAEDYGLDGALPSCGGGSFRVRVPIRASSPSRLVGTATMALPHPRVPTAAVAVTAPLVASRVAHPLHLNETKEIVRGAGHDQKERGTGNNNVEDVVPRIADNRLQTPITEEKIEGQNVLAVVRKVSAPTIEQLTPANATAGLNSTGATNSAARLSHFFTEVPDRSSLEPDGRHASPSQLIIHPRPETEEAINFIPKEPQNVSREQHSNVTATTHPPAATVEVPKPSDKINNNYQLVADVESTQKGINSQVSNREQPLGLPKQQQENGGKHAQSSHLESARALLKSIAEAKREKTRGEEGDGKRNSNVKGKSTFTNYFSSDALDLDTPRKSIIVVASPKKAKREDEQETNNKTSVSAANLSQSKSAVKIATVEMPTRTQTLELRNPHIVSFENTVVNIVSDSHHQQQPLLNEKIERVQPPLVQKSVNTIAVKCPDDKNTNTTMTNTDEKRHHSVRLAPPPPPTMTLQRSEAPHTTTHVKYVEEDDDESSGEEHASSVKPKSDAFSSRICEQALPAQLGWEGQLIRGEREGGGGIQRKHRQGILLPPAPHVAVFPSEKLTQKTYSGEEIGDNIVQCVGHGRSIVSYITTPCTREILAKMTRKGQLLQFDRFKFRDGPMTIEELAVRYDVHPDLIYDANEQTLCHGRLEHGLYTRGSTTYHFQEALPPGLVLRIPHNAAIS